MLVGSYNEKKGRGKGGIREKRRRKKEERKEKKITFPHPRESQPTTPLMAVVPRDMNNPLKGVPLK
eukprot:scaffold16392_cov40-Cyclotella_meneghiniana.AAC.1